MPRVLNRLPMIALAVAMPVLVGCPFLLGPTLLVSPLAFEFPSNKTVDSFNIVNDGKGSLTWSIDLDPAELPWLNVSPTSGSLTTSVQVVRMTVDRDLVPAGGAIGSFFVTSNGGTEEIFVQADEASDETPPTLDVSPTILDFGGSGTQDTFTVTNTGTGELDFLIDTSELAFGSISPTGGTLEAGESLEVTVEVDRTSLGSGTTTADLPISSNGGDETVQVIVSVQDLAVDPTLLDFGAQSTMESFAILNNGTSNFNFDIATKGALPPWVTSIAPVSGVVAAGGQQVVDVEIDRSGQPAGEFEAEVDITSGGGNETVTLRMEVQALQVAPATLDFGPVTESLVVTLTNIGGQAINWQGTVPNSVVWLSLDETSGAIEPGEDQQVRVDVDRGGLVPGDFNATINFTSDGGDVDVEVTMTVPLPEPTLTVSPDTMNFGSFQTERTLAIWNSGIGVIDWSIDTASFPPWLSIAPVDGDGVARGTVTGADTDIVTVTIDRFAAGAAGNFFFDMTVDGVADGGTPVDSVTVRVQMVVEAVPIISVSPEVRIPETTNIGTFEIRNAPEATGNLEWDIDFAALAENAPWLESIEPNQGVLEPGQSITVTITINRSELEDDARLEIEVASNDPDPNPDPIVIVQVSVPPRPEIFTSTDSIDLTREENTEVFEVANVGDVDTVLHFRVEVDPADRKWLFVNPPTGVSRRFPSLILDRVPIFISINRAELDPEGDTGFAIGKITIIPVEFPGGPDIDPDIVAPSDPIIVSVAPSPLQFETAVARTRIPSLVRWVMMMRDIKAQTIPIEKTISEVDGALDDNGDGIPDGIKDGAVTFPELQVLIPDVTQAEFDEADANGDGVIDATDAAILQGDPLPRLFLEHFTPKFNIFENAEPAEVVESSKFLTSASKAKTDIAILLDYSNSMFQSALAAQAAYTELIAQGEVIDNPALAGFDTAADPLQFLYEVCVGQLIMELPSFYRVTLMEFHDRSVSPGGTRVVHPLTRLNATGRQDLLNALNALDIRDHGASEVFLASLEAALELANADRRLFLESFDDADVRGLIVFSDGRVTTPPGDITETINLIIDTRVRLFTVGWGTEPANAILATLAEGTGGHFYPSFPALLEMTDSEGEVSFDEIPNPDELYDWCFTAFEAAFPDRNDIFECDQSVPRDLKQQVVLSYVTLNEEAGVSVRVSSQFDNPDDNLELCLRDQKSIDGNFVQQLDFDLVTGEIKLGQISLSTEGVVGGNAQVIVRGEYMPRNINKFEMTFTPAPDNVELIPLVDGGLIGDWTLTSLGGGTYRMDAPPGEVLQYADFGDMLRLTYNGVAPFTLLVEVDNQIYIDEGDFEPKFFTYPDSIPIMDGERFFAPAFPNPRLTCLDCVLGPLGPNNIIFFGAADEANIEIRNVGGNYPYPNASSFLTDVFLFYQILEPATVDVTPLEGILNSTLISDVLTITPNRDLQSGEQETDIIILYNAGSVNISGEILIVANWQIAPPVFNTDPVIFDFNGVDPVSFTFDVTNEGESTLRYEVVDADLLPDWVTLSRVTGLLSASEPQDTIKVTIDPVDAIDPIETTTITLISFDIFTEQPTGTKQVILNLVP